MAWPKTKQQVFRYHDQNWWDQEHKIKNSTTAFFVNPPEGVLAKHENYIILKVFKVKVLSVFGFDAFLTMLNALWWIYKKARRGIFDFMFLVWSVLVMVSKNLSFCFRQGHLELFQCSAEGCLFKWGSYSNAAYNSENTVYLKKLLIKVALLIWYS